MCQNPHCNAPRSQAKVAAGRENDKAKTEDACRAKKLRDCMDNRRTAYARHRPHFNAPRRNARAPAGSESDEHRADGDPQG